MPRVEIVLQDMDTPDGRSAMILMKPSLEDIDKAVKANKAARTPANIMALRIVEFLQHGNRNLSRKGGGLVVPTSPFEAPN